jgi:hypothetical protein
VWQIYRDGGRVFKGWESESLKVIITDIVWSLLSENHDEPVSIKIRSMDNDRVKLTTAHDIYEIKRVSE